MTQSVLFFPLLYQLDPHKVTENTLALDDLPLYPASDSNFVPLRYMRNGLDILPDPKLNRSLT